MPRFRHNECFIGTRITPEMKSLSHITKKWAYVAGNCLNIITKKKKKEAWVAGICWGSSLKKLTARRVIFLAKWLKFVCLRTLGHNDKAAQEASVLWPVVKITQLSD